MADAAVNDAAPLGPGGQDAEDPATSGGQAGRRRGPVTVVLADDQALMRMGFRMVLDAEDDIQIVGEASDGATALAQARALHPDVILMDVRMPGMNGIDATAAISEQCPDTKILILTTFDLDEYAFAGLRAGASGFLLKDTRPAELAEAIRTVAGGEAVVSPRITRRMLEMFASHLPADGSAPAQEDERIASLTPREREILLLMAQGLSNSEIADRLVVSATTVKTHVGNVLTKLDVRDRVQAVVVAYETGLMH
ncbi:response regulator transcription factor [Actinomyces sp. MRS3W]|uniref:response regulator transcription factor n=1 Tax=Actinomyces sp. MRS3W TaxID=2800796 RepID=UPI0028FD2CA3|nr:response regulator transcription factor [Actinomyces sp. MRS3W]MDU0349387.1 response regulator transcription factor [Actinomyces sp. MRS3W]